MHMDVRMPRAQDAQERPGLSYGFRPGRGQHDALDAVFMAITTRKVSWVLDADIEACLDRIEHGKLLAVLGRRLSDRRVLRLIEQTLIAGVTLTHGCLSRLVATDATCLGQVASRRRAGPLQEGA